MLVMVGNRTFDWPQASIELARQSGVTVVEMGATQQVTGHYHPSHHATCFCAVCRGQSDGHMADPCECEQCRKR